MKQIVLNLKIIFALKKNLKCMLIKLVGANNIVIIYRKNMQKNWIMLFVIRKKKNLFLRLYINIPRG